LPQFRAAESAGFIFREKEMRKNHRSGVVIPTSKEMRKKHHSYAIFPPNDKKKVKSQRRNPNKKPKNSNILTFTCKILT